MGTYNIKVFTTRSDFVELSYYRYYMNMNCQSQHTQSFHVVLQVSSTPEDSAQYHRNTSWNTSVFGIFCCTSLVCVKSLSQYFDLSLMLQNNIIQAAIIKIWCKEKETIIRAPYTTRVETRVLAKWLKNWFQNRIKSSIWCMQNESKMNQSECRMNL